MEDLMLKLQKVKSSSKGLIIAIDAIDTLKCLRLEDRGKYPNPTRWPGEGKKGELWFRNRLLWLRTIPLDNNSSLIITHAEAPAYYKGKEGQCSADLVGIWRKNAQTRFCVVELKAKTKGKGDNILYAIMEGTRNAYLHHQGFKRLREGWKDALKSEYCPKYFRNAWKEGTPFVNKLHDASVQVIIIGDYGWMEGQKKWTIDAIKLAREIEKRLNFDVSVYFLNKKVKPASKPYVLLPINKLFVLKGSI